MDEEGTPRVGYEDTIEGGHVCFLRVCPVCHRWVRPDNDTNMKDDNASCTKHGRVRMPCEGYF
jgi:hypothetical protein